MGLVDINVRGVKLSVRPKTWDDGVVREVIAADTYRVLGWAPTNPVTVFDVGGHIGSFTCWLASRLPLMRAFVFEMDTDNQRVLEHNLRAFPNVTLVRAALGAKTGEAWRSAPTDNNAAGEILWAATDGASRVPTISIVEYMTDHEIPYIDCLKLDCEGSEFSILDALASMPGGIRAHVGSVRAEVHAARTDHRFTRLMAQLVDAFPFVETTPTTSPVLHMAYAWR